MLLKWLGAFNNADVKTLIQLYDDNAINHQVANDPVVGKDAIKRMLKKEFSEAEMVYIP